MSTEKWYDYLNSQGFDAIDLLADRMKEIEFFECIFNTLHVDNNVCVLNGKIY